MRRRDGDTRDARESVDGGGDALARRRPARARRGSGEKKASSFALALEGLRETEPLLHDAHVVRHEGRLTLAAAAEITAAEWPAVAVACAATVKHMARVVSARHPGLVDQRAALRARSRLTKALRDGEREARGSRRAS